MYNSRLKSPKESKTLALSLSNDYCNTEFKEASFGTVIKMNSFLWANSVHKITSS